MTALTEAIRADAAGEPGRRRGRLRIGDDWNAITIIALSQSSPLKAIAELVENSIDAKAHTVTITRGREHGRSFLAIRDDGEGVPRPRPLEVLRADPKVAAALAEGATITMVPDSLGSDLKARK